VQHAQEWNVVAAMRDLLDMMLDTAQAVVLGATKTKPSPFVR
jgi:hypothetical protein